MQKYGEILFIGKCNQQCYYCLSHEMNKMRTEGQSQMNVPFEKWKNFEEFLTKCEKADINTIYLSSTITDPALYCYLLELILELKQRGFKVGVRTNGTDHTNVVFLIHHCDEEISFSLQSLDPTTYKQITGSTLMPDWDWIFKNLSLYGKQCRISIVVNQYNEKEIPYILDFLSGFNNLISYVQLRKVYKYGPEDKIETQSYENIVTWLKKHSVYGSNYYESEIYQYRNLKVSLWNDVFRKDSIQSINYFTDGTISTNNLLIPAYEKGETEYSLIPTDKPVGL